MNECIWTLLIRRGDYVQDINREKERERKEPSDKKEWKMCETKTLLGYRPVSMMKEESITVRGDN
jgi:hypothetical protein